MAWMWERSATRARRPLGVLGDDDDVGLTLREEGDDEEVGAVPLDSSCSFIMIF
jgi:hypothetical protein